MGLGAPPAPAADAPAATHEAAGLDDGTAARPAVEGSGPYQQAFAALAKRDFAAARASVRQLDEKSGTGRAERCAVEAFLDFIGCRFDSAQTKVAEALAADERQPLALMIKAQLLMSAGSENEAAECAASAAAGDPRNALMLWWTACLHGMDRWQAKIGFLKQAIAIGESSTAPLDPQLIRSMQNGVDRATRLRGRPTEVWNERSAGRVELPLLRDAAGLPAVELPLADGRTRVFRLDTGLNGPPLLLMSEAAPGCVDETTEVLSQDVAQTVEGALHKKTVLLKAFSFAGMEFASVRCAVAPESNCNVLGVNMFRHGVLVLDFKRDRLLFFMDRTAFEQEWAERLRRASRQKFRTCGGFIYVPCGVRPAASRESMGAALLDTAAGMSCLNAPFARESDIDSEEEVVARIAGAGGNARETPAQVVRDVSLTFGGVTFPLPELLVFELPIGAPALGMSLPDPSVLLGFPEISQLDFLVFDFPKRYLHASGGRSPAPLESSSGR